MLDCVSVPYSNYANLVSSVLDAREVWLVLDMLVQRYDEFGPSDRWFSCLSTNTEKKPPGDGHPSGAYFVLTRITYFLGYL